MGLSLPRPGNLPGRLQSIERGIQRPLFEAQQPAPADLQPVDDFQPMGLAAPSSVASTSVSRCPRSLSP